MPHLLIRLRRKSDGTGGLLASLTCVRADGTVTWQRQEGGYAAVMPEHDLTHYAVETALGYTQAFYGLIAAGWDIQDFAPPYPRGPIPREAREAELVVGVFQGNPQVNPQGSRRVPGGGGDIWTPQDVRERGAQYAASTRDARKRVEWPPLSDGEICRVIAARADVMARWEATERGKSLELVFSPIRALPRT